ncbi:MAG: methyltransferase domain-containing protein [Cytophagaceae bacterium]|jgi:ubiquinone/menaquinone biosynthesis C-methylase UbiE|nr:methyltransferase domain-containing protein [Cytophagaceae bacterium]
MSTSLFKHRARGQEYLDQPDVKGQDLEQNLRELKFINQTLGGNQVTLQALREVVATKPHHLWMVADLGCGGGDMLKLISRELRNKRVKFSLVGIDYNEHILRYALMNTFEFGEIRYCQENVLTDEFDANSFDIINATLFCHHFSNEQLIQLFRKLKQEVKVAVILNDLQRHPFAFYSISMLTRLFSKSYMVKHDAPLSVLRGFTKKELETIFKEAGFTRYSIQWRWAFRWKVILWTGNS